MMDTISFASRRTNRASRQEPSVDAGIAHELTAEQLDILVTLWKTVLDQETAAIEDHFFEIGGTSLDAMLMSARIKKMLGVQISLTTFFDEPTLEMLYEEVRVALFRKAQGQHDLVEVNCKEANVSCG